MKTKLLLLTSLASVFFAFTASAAWSIFDFPSKSCLVLTNDTPGCEWSFYAKAGEQENEVVLGHIRSMIASSTVLDLTALDGTVTAENPNGLKLIALGDENAKNSGDANSGGGSGNLFVNLFWNEVAKGVENIQSVQLPETVKMLGFGAFGGLKGLTSFNAPFVTNVSINVFWDCTSLTSIDLTGAEILGDRAFGNANNLACDCYFPKVTSIIHPSWANYPPFSSVSKITSLVMPLCTNDVNEVMTATAAWGTITNLYLPRVTGHYQGPVRNAQTIDLSSVTSVRTLSFNNCPYLKSVKIPRVETIPDVNGSDVFAKSPCIEFIDVSSLKLAGYGTLAASNQGTHESALKHVDLPSLTSLCHYNFYRCSNLRQVRFPYCMESITSFAFTESYVTNLYVHIKSPWYAAGNFANYLNASTHGGSKVVTAYGGSFVADDVEWIYDDVRWDEESLGYVFTNELTVVAAKRVADGAALSGEVVIPRRLDGRLVTAVEACAFKDCEGITSIELPSSVTRVGLDAFARCPNLTTIVLASSAPADLVSALRADYGEEKVFVKPAQGFRVIVR